MIQIKRTDFSLIDDNPFLLKRTFMTSVVLHGTPGSGEGRAHICRIVVV